MSDATFRLAPPCKNIACACVRHGGKRLSEGAPVPPLHVNCHCFLEADLEAIAARIEEGATLDEVFGPPRSYLLDVPFPPGVEPPVGTWSVADRRFRTVSQEHLDALRDLVTAADVLLAALRDAGETSWAQVCALSAALEGVRATQGTPPGVGGGTA